MQIYALVKHLPNIFRKKFKYSVIFVYFVAVVRYLLFIFAFEINNVLIKFIMVNLRIKDICAQKGITQKNLSEMIEVSTTSLSRIITGEQKPSLDTLEKVAVALNVPISALFEAERDFIAFVRRNGETFTFESEKALKEYAATLPAED